MATVPGSGHGPSRIRLLVVVLWAALLSVSACGAAGTASSALPASASSTPGDLPTAATAAPESAPATPGTTSTTTAPSRPEPVGVRPPGPPGATFPDALQAPVDRWFTLLSEGDCGPLVAETTAALAVADAGVAATTVAHLYRSGGYACLGRVEAATRDLERVDVDTSGWFDCTRQPELLKRWVETVVAAAGGDKASRALLEDFPQPSRSSCVDSGTTSAAPAAESGGSPSSEVPQPGESSGSLPGTIATAAATS